MSQRSQKLELNWYNKDQALIPTEEGKYGYTWVNPSDPRYCETHTLIFDETIRGTQASKNKGTPYSGNADLEPTNDNLLILGESGDVLESLTRVPELSEKYVGKVKCIYIDPPFNTAQTFANYEDNLEHSIWLTMMRDRLIHLRRLLSDNGSIWVHLDDVESHRMRVLLDEVFGSSNFVAEVSWRANDSSSNNAKSFAKDHNIIFVYGKNIGWLPKHLPDPSKQSHYKNPDNDPRGPWYDGRDVQNPKDRPNLKYSITSPNGKVIQPPTNGWRWDWDTMQKKISTGEVYFNDSETSLKRKTYLWEQDGLPPSDTWSDSKMYGSSRKAKNHLKQLFPGVPTPELFDTPKPEELIKRIVELATEPNDIVCDIFAGSGTTAAVAHKMGRRWITTELSESTFTKYTLPRMQKVVEGTDFGGISRDLSLQPRVDVEVPPGFTPDDLKETNDLLNGISNLETSSSSLLESIKEVKKALRTIDPTKKNYASMAPVNWRGGGSFKVAHLSPACFDYDPALDLVTLTEKATGQTLIGSVAANLGFYLTPEDRQFDGALGRQLLAVVEGVLDEEKVDDLMAHLPQGHTLVLAAIIVSEGVREYVRSFKNGSRVVNIPLDIFPYTQKQKEN
ncbi:site-specific DNA-methyltransferase [Corynebacterium stationis]|uniref:site-specific DNA-methyltransferase n=1 Tax=Corynebacterium stationis TaxID=1705 RepID=UPI002628541C|nr:site-specific DNA-methyltransferase [Corynebacterium stationis]